MRNIKGALFLGSMLMTCWAWAENKMEVVQEYKLTAPAMGALVVSDLMNDGKKEILANLMGQGLVVKSSTMEWTYKMHQSRSTPTVVDLDGDGKKEILLTECNESKKCFLTILNASGKVQNQWPISGETKGAVVVADLFGNKQNYFIISTLQSKLEILDAKGKSVAGFPKDLGGSLDDSEVLTTPTPVVGNLDGNVQNGMEIVVVTNQGKVFAFHADGKELPAFPRELKTTVFASPLLVDLNSDGIGEIILPTGNGEVHVLQPNGAPLDGFPVKTDAQIIASPVVFDIDGDGKLDLFVGNQNQKVYGFDHKGKAMAGFPRVVKGRITATPLVLDMESNHRMNLVVLTESGFLYAFKALGHSVEGYPLALGKGGHVTPCATDLDNVQKLNLVYATMDNQIRVLEDPRKRVGIRKELFWSGFRTTNSLNGSIGSFSKPAVLKPAPELKIQRFQVMESSEKSKSETQAGKDPMTSPSTTSTGDSNKPAAQACSVQNNSAPSLWWAFLLLFLVGLRNKRK